MLWVHSSLIWVHSVCSQSKKKIFWSALEHTQQTQLAVSVYKIGRIMVKRASGTLLTLSMLGNCAFLSSADFFFKIKFCRK